MVAPNIATNGNTKKVNTVVTFSVANRANEPMRHSVVTMNATGMYGYAFFVYMKSLK